MQERKNDEMKPKSGETDLAGRPGARAAGGVDRAPADLPGAGPEAAAAGAAPTGAGGAAGTADEAFLEPTPDPIAALEAELAAARTEAATCRDSWYRTVADLDNFRKRSARDLAEGQERARAEVLLAMILALDDVERALAASSPDAGADPDAGGGLEEAAGTGAAADPIVAGLRLIRGRITDSLRRFGVAEIPAAGAAFDPHVHEAVMQAPAAGVPAGHVAHVLERGYRLNERVLRPARVVVAMESA